MTLITTLSLCFYLAVLAMTQTAYGDPFMNARWLALALLMVASGITWCSRNVSRRTASPGGNSDMIFIVYLCITILGVFSAENVIYSGLKWISYVTMVSVFLVFLREGFSLKQVKWTFLVVKGLIVSLLLVSWLHPMSGVKSENAELFRGAFGSPNAFGQIAAVGSLLFLHDFLTDERTSRRWTALGLGCVSAWFTWSSGARSAMVAFLCGITLMSYFYPGKIKGKAFWMIILLITIALCFPQLPQQAKQFVLRSKSSSGGFTAHLFVSRTSVWSAAWQGFQKRPLFGWGFGADDTITRDWEVKFTSMGTVNRDSINDTLIVLESTGIVGLIGYCLLILLAIKQLPGPWERKLLRTASRPPPGSKSRDISFYHVHVICFIVSMSLLIMVQFDNTALSGGNLISALVWLTVALAGSIRIRTARYEDSGRRRQVARARSLVPAAGGLDCRR